MNYSIIFTEISFYPETSNYNDKLNVPKVMFGILGKV